MISAWKALCTRTRGRSILHQDLHFRLSPVTYQVVVERQEEEEGEEE